MPKWNPTELIEHFELPNPNPNGPRLFVLGCLESRRVTMASQQVRAINLIHAIATQHYEEWNSNHVTSGDYIGWVNKHREIPRVLVVGGSAGGLTAAAYAAFRGAKVTVYEENCELMPNLRDSDRFLHPRLYEWGSPQLFKTSNGSDYWRGSKVGLPVLDWNAGPAYSVRDTLIREWESIEKFYSVNVMRSRKLCSLDDIGEEFDYVILAVGFGVESSLPHADWPKWIGESTGSYWKRDQLDQREGHFLICGNGDGALTDLFRICIRNFAQESLADIIELACATPGLEQEIKSIEEIFVGSKPSSLLGDPLVSLAQSYLSLRSDALDNWVNANLRRNVHVKLSVLTTGSISLESAFSRNTFPINRLLLASLLRVSQRNNGSPVSIVHPTGESEIPDLSADGEAYCLVYRIGVPRKIKPIFLLRPLDERLGGEYDLMLDQIKLRNADDVTRLPLWSSFGEVATVPPLPEFEALVPRLRPKTDEQFAAEVFEGTKEFVYLSDVFDSVFQGVAFTSPENEAAANAYFLGLLRFCSLMYDRILITDTQLWDGAYFLRLPSLWNRLDSFEKGVLREKLEFRVRAKSELFPQPEDRLYVLNSKELGLVPRPIQSSNLGDRVSKDYQDWCRRNPGLTVTGAADVLRHFVEYKPEYKEVILLQLENWKALKQIIDQEFRCVAWPDWRTTRFWDPRQQLENPGQFHAALSIEGRAILEETFKNNYSTIERSIHVKYLRERAGEHANGKKSLLEEIGQIQDWFDRAYNRMVAKNQGANVFGALYLGDAPGSTESGSAEILQHEASILELGRIDSSWFERLYRDWTSKRKQWADRQTYQLFNKGLWYAALEQIAAIPQDTRARLDFDLKGVNTNNRALLKMRRFASMATIRVNWIGDVKSARPNEGIVRQTKTEEVDESGSMRDESNTEISPLHKR